MNVSSELYYISGIHEKKIQISIRELISNISTVSGMSSNFETAVTQIQILRSTLSSNEFAK